MSEEHNESEGDLSDLVAQAYSDTELNPEEDTPALNIMSNSLLGGGDLEKVPLERAANLLKAREAARAIRHDEITPEEFLQQLLPIQELAENGVKLFAAEVVKKETEKLPPEQQEVVAAFEKQVYVLKEGIELMASYADTGLIDDLDRGLELVEQSMVAVDEIQDRASELAEIEKEEKEAAEAAKGQAQEPETP